MKAVNVLVIIMAAIFFFASVGFCNDIEQEDNISSHCIMHCAGGCHAFTQQNNPSFINPSTISAIAFPHEILHQSLVIRGIDRPPNTF